jgi:hypothetical protein
VTDDEPIAYPVRAEVTVTVEVARAGSPETVTVDPLTLTEPTVALADQLYAASKFEIWKVKPVPTGVVALKRGVKPTRLYAMTTSPLPPAAPAPELPSVYPPPPPPPPVLLAPAVGSTTSLRPLE